MRSAYFVAGSFVILVFLTIIFVTTLLPAFTFKPTPSAVAHQYTAKELKGRNVYKREGCFYCHSQFGRYQDREGQEVVQAGDYAYETPHLLGTSRTGPDLSNVGGKYPKGWHKTHHMYPRKVKPGSIMPSYSYLSDEDMDALIAYIDTVGKKRKAPTWVNAPQEFRDQFDRIKAAVDVNSAAAASAGRGIYMQNCAQCHGVTGKGNGIVSRTMLKKPANFTRPFYSQYADDMWYFRTAEGVPGTRMPKWGQSLGKEQMLYLVAFLKTLPQKSQGEGVEVLGLNQVDDAEKLSRYYYSIHPEGNESKNAGYELKGIPEVGGE